MEHLGGSLRARLVTEHLGGGLRARLVTNTLVVA